jgi:hypothetical protein
MIETFTALFFAHLIADFVLQPKSWVETKATPLTLLKHGLVVLSFSIATTGALHPALVALALVHVLTDLAKSKLTTPGLGPFLADQALHLATIAALAWLVPGLWAAGLWAEVTGLAQIMAYGAGAILATRTGQFAVDFLMRAHTPSDAKLEGLPQGGATIGLLERALIFVLILAGEMAAIGLLIAAKSVLRFGTVSESRAASEYVIIGTLASFGWAIIAALATRELAALLPPLEIVAPSP